LNTALKHSNPEDYVSCLHVHQDGSCNGLQHYAALGRDMEGAYQVNLGPTERPGDVYTHVAKMVIKMVDNDIANTQS
jgi:DNA-directed RNA polymerase